VQHEQALIEAKTNMREDFKHKLKQQIRDNHNLKESMRFNERKSDEQAQAYFVQEANLISVFPKLTEAPS
jgi:hypothetical protein